MKQKYYIIKLLLKIWFGILCISLLCTTGILWLRTQNIKPVPDMDTSYRGMALALVNFGNFGIIYRSNHFVLELLCKS